MERYKLQPLSAVEISFAEDNHNLVYGFIHRYGYSLDYYDIVVFGYLKAVQIYHRRKSLQNKYDFAFINWWYCRSEIGNYYRTEHAQKRKAANELISLDADYNEMENLYNLVSGTTTEDDVVEKILVYDMIEKFSGIQREIIRLKIEGYNNKEVYCMLGISSSTYYSKMKKMRLVFKNITNYGN